MSEAIDVNKTPLFESATKVASYEFDPGDLAIAGGADALPVAERGRLDTETDKANPLYDERLKLKLTNEWVANIAEHGVKETINIVRIEGVPFVVNGRQRVRGARVANVARLAAGKEPIKIRANLVKGDEVALLSEMILTNIHQDDTTPTKIAKLQRLIARGVSVEDSANLFAIKLQTAKAWLQYDETAIPAVKKAVNAGKIPQTTGADIARLGKAEKQEKALLAVLNSAASADNKGAGARGGGATKAKRAIASAANPDKSPGMGDKKTQKKFLAMVLDKPHKGEKPETVAWWRGVGDALALVIGGEECDERLTKLLAQLDSAPALEAPKASKSKPATTVETDLDSDEE